jgi:hypothetical protein
MKSKIIKILESYEDSLNMIEYTKYESIANDIIDLFKFNEYEIKELNKQLSQAVDAAGAYIERAREAEAMVRDMDKGYLKLGLHG